MDEHCLVLRRLTWSIQGLMPDVSTEPFIEVYRSSDGQFLDHINLRPDPSIKLAPPLLCQGRLLFADDQDLVMRDYRSADGEQVPDAWRVAGSGDELADGRLSDDGRLLVGSRVDEYSHVLRRVADGVPIFSCPGDPWSRPILRGSRLVNRLPDGHIAEWDLSSGERVWRSQLSDCGLLAAGKDLVLIRDEERQLHSLLRSNGQLRRSYRQWTDCISSQADRQRCHCVVMDDQQRQQLVSIDLRSGEVLWQFAIPPWCELAEERLLPLEQGIGCVVRDHHRQRCLLLIDDRGALARAHVLQEGDGIQALGKRLLMHQAGGMRIMPEDQASSEALPPLPLHALDELPEPAALCQKPGSEYGPWRLACGRLADGRLCIAVQLPEDPDAAALFLALAEDGHPFIAGPCEVRIDARGQIFPLQGAWECLNPSIDAQTNCLLLVFRQQTAAGGLTDLAPLPRLRIGHDGSAPWWLNQGWHMIVPADK